MMRRSQRVGLAVAILSRLGVKKAILAVLIPTGLTIVFYLDRLSGTGLLSQIGCGAKCERAPNSSRGCSSCPQFPNQ